MLRTLAIPDYTGSVEVGGSIPPGSTNTKKGHPTGGLFLYPRECGSSRRRRYDEAQDVQMPRRPWMAESGRAWLSMSKVTQRVAFFCIRESVVRAAEGGTMRHRMCKCRGWPRAAEPGPRCRRSPIGWPFFVSGSEWFEPPKAAKRPRSASRGTCDLKFLFPRSVLQHTRHVIRNLISVEFFYRGKNHDRLIPK